MDILSGQISFFVETFIFSSIWMIHKIYSNDGKYSDFLRLLHKIIHKDEVKA